MASGLKLWAPGNTLASADVNDYLSKQSVMRFATISARNSAVTSPVGGQVAYCDDSKETYIYQGSTSSWVSLIPRTISTIGQQIKNNSTSLSDYNGGGGTTHQISLEASSTYVFRMEMEYATNTTPDIQFNVPYSGTVNSSRWMPTYIYYNATDATGTRLDSLTMVNIPLAPGGLGNTNFLPFLAPGWIKTTTAGTLKLQFAQQNLNASDTILQFACWNFWKTA